MSIPVALAALAERIEEFPPVAYLITVGAERQPHVVSVRPGWEDGALVVTAGGRTAANVGAGATVTLLWPATPGAGYSLIIDGTARVVDIAAGPAVAIAPTAAVLHRTPEGDPSAPGCITVLTAG
jgi:hypothetical protein